jgi:hypothetical protein
MGTSDWTDRKRGGVIEMRSRAFSQPMLSLAQPRTRGAALAVVSLFLLGGCLDLLGDVNVDAIRRESFSNEPWEDCSDAGLADGSCVVRCPPGIPRCNDNLLQRCNDTGDGLIFVDQCASAALCDAVAMRCERAVCGEREHRCTESGELQECNADRTGFEFREQCRSAAFCSAVPGRSQCEGAACRPGRQRCNGPQIEVCRDDRAGYDVVGEPCASAALCVEGAGDVATCSAPACTPGAFACEAALLTRCSDDANRFITVDECETPELCLAAEQRCIDPLCGVGQQRCTGAVLERCNAARDNYVPVQTCASPAACDATQPQCLSTPPVDPPPDPSVLNGPAYDFVGASSSAVLGLGPMTLRVPAQWSDVDRSAWVNSAGVTIGPRFIASSNAARFARNFDIPGVYFAATAEPPVDVAGRLRDFDLSSRCTAGASLSYEDDLYEGTEQRWTNCGTTSATASVVVALDKETSSFVTIVIVTMVAPRDDEARLEIWDSFIADPNN